ncbi:hypothetical protein TCAL_16617 [Tigriopus californicus]|uniref:F-box domain-containing protein n=1 Tax=Tigriopus californicus TaxID=6832 RepID=A0A553NAQ2_TIGCA|nr:hypothetical protein TCAL_16617 [Tigriopus californicus]
MAASGSDLHLSDEVWLLVCTYLDALSLIASSQSGIPGLARSALDKSRWTHVVVQPQTQSKSAIRPVVAHLGPHTQSLIVRGNNKHFGKKRPKGAREIVSTAFMQGVKLHCVNLRHLSLEYQTIDIHTGFLKLIPKSVTHFSLEGTHLTNLPMVRTTVISPLFKIYKFVPALEERTLNRAPEGHWDNTALKPHPLQGLLPRNRIRAPRDGRAP